MIAEILGILSDIIGVVFVWWNPSELTLFWKITLSVLFIAAAIGVFLLAQDPTIARVNKYAWEDNQSIMLFAKKNRNFSSDMLVSIYMTEGTTPILCAIGYVTIDPTGKLLHVMIVHIIKPDVLERIRTSTDNLKRFYVTPYVRHNEVSELAWQRL